MGARVIPIKYNWEFSKIEYILERINGLFLPGGDVPLYKNDSSKDELNDFTKLN